MPSHRVLHRLSCMRSCHALCTGTRHCGECLMRPDCSGMGDGTIHVRPAGVSQIENISTSSLYISRSIYGDIGIRPYIFGHAFAVSCACIECFRLHDFIEPDWQVVSKMPVLISDLSGHFGNAVRQAIRVLQMRLWKCYRIKGWFGSPEVVFNLDRRSSCSRKL